MKTFVRFVLYMGFSVSAVLVLVRPLRAIMEGGALDMTMVGGHAVAGFALVWIGAEISDWLKKRWGG